MLPTRWTAAAERDLTRIVDYLWPRSRVGARTESAGIVATVDRIASLPESGEVALELEPDGDLRRVVSGHYLIFYRIRTDAIRILRIWDSRRDPATLRLPDEEG